MSLLPSAETSPKANRWILTLLAGAVLLYFIYLLRYVLLPFVLAGALAFVLSPVVKWLHERWRLPRWASAAMFLLVLAAAGAAIGYELKVHALPQIVDALNDEQAILQRLIATLLHGHTFTIGGKIYGAPEITQAILGAIRINPSDVLPGVGLAVGVFMGLMLTAVLLFYFLADGPRLQRGLLWLAPPALRPRASAIARRAKPMIFRYVRGVIVIGIYATSMTFVVAHFALGASHAVILAIAVGFLELVPVFGPFLAMILILLLALDHMTFGRIVGVALFAAGLRLSIDQLVGPLVLGKSVSLPPPAIIFAFLAGGAIWGPLGIVIAIPAAATIKIVLEEAYGDSIAADHPARDD